MKLSARNKLPGIVRGITRGEAIANVEIEVSGQRLVASITVEAVEELALSEGTPVTAVIKASDVMVATDRPDTRLPSDRSWSRLTPLGE